MNYARAALSRQLTQRYKQSKTNNSGISVNDKQRLLSRLSGDRNFDTTQNNNSEKQRLLREFDSKKVDELRKRQKFAPHEENIIDGGDGGDFTICDLFDTGFEDNCDYYGNLYILGNFKLLNGFETTDTESISIDLFNFSKIEFEEDFETETTSSLISSDFIFFG